MKRGGETLGQGVFGAHDEEMPPVAERFVENRMTVFAVSQQDPSLGCGRCLVRVDDMNQQPLALEPLADSINGFYAGTHRAARS